MSKYDDIINLNRPISKYPHLSIDSRASQFGSFSALTGYEDEVKEVERITCKKIEISDDFKNILNNKINYLNNHIKDKIEVTITYFVKDLKKDGGIYINKKGFIKKLDFINKNIKLDDNFIININDIININFEEINYE